MKMILDSHWLIHYFFGESMGNIFFLGVANPQIQVVAGMNIYPQD